MNLFQCSAGVSVRLSSIFIEMPSFCIMVNCSNAKDKRPDLSFCRVPKIVTNQGPEIEELTAERRRLWMSAISRGDLTEEILANDRVCGEHFLSGKAAFVWDRTNVDWVHSINLGHKKKDKENNNDRRQQIEERSKRMKERRKREQEREDKEAIRSKLQRLDEPGNRVKDCMIEGGYGGAENGTNKAVESDEENFQGGVCNQAEHLGNTRNFGTQTELCEYMLCSQNRSIPEEIKVVTEDYFRGDDKKVRFYTGFPSFDVLLKTFGFVEKKVSRRSVLLTKFQEFTLVLVKLRLNVPNQDLAYRFHVSRTVVSIILATWLYIMDICLSPLIVWPSRETLHRSMPRCFVDSFGLHTTVIIDCFEIFIDKPTNLNARAQTYSNYKHHCTVKVLIGITPQGAISFVSEAWGGHTSDKFLTENCGFMSKLLPGDLVLADRGFTIHEKIWFQHADLNIPAFTKGKEQLDPIDIEKTRKIANVRIHVRQGIHDNNLTNWVTFCFKVDFGTLRPGEQN